MLMQARGDKLRRSLSVSATPFGSICSVIPSMHLHSGPPTVNGKRPNGLAWGPREISDISDWSGRPTPPLMKGCSLKKSQRENGSDVFPMDSDRVRGNCTNPHAFTVFYDDSSVCTMYSGRSSQLHFDTVYFLIHSTPSNFYLPINSFKVYTI